MTILANGQVTLDKTTIFEVGAGIERATIEKITLFNTTSVSQDVTIFVKKRFGTSRKVRQFQLLENENGEYLEPGETLPLGNGDIIEAATDSAEDPEETNVIAAWRGAVEPAEENPSGNEIKLYRGAVEPFSDVAIVSGIDFLVYGSLS